MAKPKHRWQPDEARGGAKGIFKALEKCTHRKEPMGADEGNDLIDRHQEGYGIDHSQQPKEEEAGKPVGGMAALYRHTSNLMIPDQFRCPTCLRDNRN